ncbi:hypothetical protein QN277_009307, partial [Acacia crassicarpa]
YTVRSSAVKDVKVFTVLP